MKEFSKNHVFNRISFVVFGTLTFWSISLILKYNKLHFGLLLSLAYIGREVDGDDFSEDGEKIAWNYHK